MLSSISQAKLINLDNLIQTKSGHQVVINPFNQKENLIIWGYGAEPKLKNLGKWEEKVLSAKKYMGNGSVHIGNINYIDKGQNLVKVSGDDVDVLVGAVKWVNNQEKYWVGANIEKNFYSIF